MKREFAEYVIGTGTATAHTVTDETAGTVITIGQVPKESKAGDVLVKTSNPDIFELITATEWDAMSPQAADTPIPYELSQPEPFEIGQEEEVEE